MSPPADVPRNAPCPCGSGKRYKHCHGLGGAGPASPPSLDALMRRAIDAQKARRRDEAERAYREVLAQRPDEPDALHMLGVLRHERGDAEEAIALTLRALDLTGWRVAFMRSNLGILLANRGGEAYEDALRRMLARHAAMLATRAGSARPVSPLVSVVVPAYNHARYVERALESAVAQTYRRLEIVVVDDGSTDATADLAARVLEASGRPHRIVRRENRGASATLNDAVALSGGEYLQFLNSDDALAPARIETMVERVAGVGAQWGYSSVALMDAEGAPVDVMRHPRAYQITCDDAAVRFRHSVGFSLIPGNTSVSSGNLFVARTLFDRVGGFREYRWNHDWDFCLRALWIDEPAFVPEPLYRYRLHAANTIDESADRSRAEMGRITAEYLARAMDDRATPPNPFAPAIATWGDAFLDVVLSSGIGGVVDPQVLRALAQAKLKRAPAEAAAAR